MKTFEATRVPHAVELLLLSGCCSRQPALHAHVSMLEKEGIVKHPAWTCWTIKASPKQTTRVDSFILGALLANCVWCWFLSAAGFSQRQKDTIVLDILSWLSTRLVRLLIFESVSYHLVVN
jgi:hypothetical protein